MYGTAFTQITKSAQSGDILILESGYNDKTYDTKEIMTSAVTNMVTEAKAKGLSVVLVSPNASQHDYKADVAWTSVMEAVATDTTTPYINLAKLSYDFLFAQYGTDTATVKADYNVSDGLHSTYNGAMKMASIVAKELAGMDEYSSLVDQNYTYTFTDSKGATITCQAK